jgi:hypothetical protein
MQPDILGPDRVVRVAIHEIVLEESHVLEAENGDLMLWLQQSLGLS